MHFCTLIKYPLPKNILKSASWCQQHLIHISQLNMSHLPVGKNLHILPSDSINHVIINYRKNIMQWFPGWNKCISNYSATYYSGGCEQGEMSEILPLLRYAVSLQTVREKEEIVIWGLLCMHWHIVRESITKWCFYSCISINNCFIIFFCYNKAAFRYFVC